MVPNAEVSGNGKSVLRAADYEGGQVATHFVATGDIGRLSGCGVEFVGRSDQQVKISGICVHPQRREIYVVYILRSD